MRIAEQIGRLSRGWARAAFRLDPRSLAAFRMALGVIVCADAVLRSRDFRIMFSADGLFPPQAVRGFQNDPAIWSLCHLSESLVWQGVMLAAEGVAGLSLAAGLFTRSSCLMAWIAMVSVIRRTAPASNAGDLWLATLLFWGLFLPLGAVWSIDAWRTRRDGRGAAWGVPLVLQIAGVYFTAGLAKCNADWLTGSAVTHALSVHDHGTPLGEWVSQLPAIGPLLSWSVLGIELAGPVLLVALPLPAVRFWLVVTFLAFHAAIACLMTVGLFAPIGLAAWLSILPAAAWDRLPWSRLPVDHTADRPATAPLLQACLTVLAAVACVHMAGGWRSSPLPAAIARPLNFFCLHQPWNMFGDVPEQRQWVYGLAELADGRTVDLLRNGRPMKPPRLQADWRPEGGFTSLRHHRWHKIFWELSRPPMQVFAPSIASAVVRDWNASHGPSEQVRSLEIRFVRLPTADGGTMFHDLLMATWPERDPHGRGNLERFLEAAGRETAPAAVSSDTSDAR